MIIIAWQLSTNITWMGDGKISCNDKGRFIIDVDIDHNILASLKVVDSEKFFPSSSINVGTSRLVPYNNKKPEALYGINRCVKIRNCSRSHIKLIKEMCSGVARDDLTKNYSHYTNKYVTSLSTINRKWMSYLNKSLWTTNEHWVIANYSWLNLLVVCKHITWLL